MWRIDLLDWEEVTDDQKLARGMLKRYRWLLLENTFQQISLGLLPAEVQEQSLVWAQLRKPECHLRDWMPVNPDPAFTEFLDSLRNECAD